MKLPAAIAVVALLLLSACNSTQSTQPSQLAASSEPSGPPSVALPTPSRAPASTDAGASPQVALPTIAAFDGSCADIGGDFRIAGDPSDPRLAWLETSLGRSEAVFPPGYTARFQPDLEILNASGRVVLHEGDIIHGACVTGANTDDAPLLIVEGWEPSPTPG